MDANGGLGALLCSCSDKALITGRKSFMKAGHADLTSNQRGCRVNRRAVDVSPGIECMGTDDGATQKATQGFKTLEAHKTRWVLYPARAKNTGAKLGRAKYRMRQTGLPRKEKPSEQSAPPPERDQEENHSALIAVCCGFN